MMVVVRMRQVGSPMRWYDGGAGMRQVGSRMRQVGTRMRQVGSP